MINFSSVNYVSTYYNMVNRMQRYQPTYSPSFQQPYYQSPQPTNPFRVSNDMQQAVSNVYADAKGLKVNADELRLENSDSPLHTRQATSTDTNALTADVKEGATAKEYSIKVNQLAQAQKNEGTALSGSAQTTMNAGTNTFTLTSGGDSQTLSVDITGTETNEEALNKLSTAINDAGIGVKASVVKDTAAGTVQLALESSATGTDEAFTIADVSGNAVSASGAAQTSQQAQNAKYTLDKYFTKESQSNTISLDEGNVSVTLKDVTSDAETISVAGNTDEIIEAAKSLVTSYNDLKGTQADYGGMLSSAVNRNLDRGLYSYQLEQLGISKSANGELSLDEDKLKENLQEKGYQFDRTINALDSLSDNLYKTSDRISQLPSAAIMNQENAFGFNSYAQAYSSMYQPYSYMSSGMFYDQYF
ncbi:flagellar filament capping protein FliD [Bacillus tianshenii]|nr:flagellar filament capping protein FliD [Bacillus tianshenii]